jgi:hypothetical protein
MPQLLDPIQRPHLQARPTITVTSTQDLDSLGQSTRGFCLPDFAKTSRANFPNKSVAQK